MAKRRTRKQKLKAKHRFKISWEPSSSTNVSEAKKGVSEPDVKRQFGTAKKQKQRKNEKRKLAKDKAKYHNLASIRRDLVKSLVLASTIIGLELVIYLAWY